MRLLLCALATLTAVGIIGCNQSSESRGLSTKATDYSFEALSGHQSAACPSLRGVYIPVEHFGTQFQITERGGYLVISTRGLGGTNFSEVIVVSGVTLTYGNGDTAAAKCVAGQIVMLSTSTSGARVQVTFEPTAQGFLRSVKRPRNPPVVTQYYQQ